MKIEIDDIGWSQKEIGERILRAYEAGEISTGRAYELLKKLFNGHKTWNPALIWENC
jgi:hypothetical protein